MPAKQRLVLVGSGGMAREIEWIIRCVDPAQERWEIVGNVVSESKYLPDRPDPRIMGTIDDLDELRVDAIVMAIGEASVRRPVSEIIQSNFPAIDWPVLVHPTAVFDHHSVKLGRGAIVAAGVVATVAIDLGEYSFLNINTTVGHGCRIGAGSMVHPGANIAGDVTIEEDVLIGTGSQVLRFVRVGARSVVGAGALVTKDVAADTVVAGIPARPMLKRQD